MTYQWYDGLCPYIFSHLNIGIMLRPNDILNISLRYSEFRDKMIVVVTTEETEYECLSITTNSVGNVCMHGLLCRKIS